MITEEKTFRNKYVGELTVTRYLDTSGLSDEERLNIKPWLDLDLSNRPGEVWKDVPDFEGLYQVSNQGRLKSFNIAAKRKDWSGSMIMCQGPSYDRDLYLEANFNKNGKIKYIRVHRIVAQCFVENPDNKPFIDHINNDKRDNRAENLRWCTPMENMIWADEDGLLNKTVRCRSIIDIETGTVYSSSNEVCIELDIDDGLLSRCLKQHLTVNGHKLQSLDEYLVNPLKPDDFDNIDYSDEIWVDIPGLEGIYQFSSCDRVRSLPPSKDNKRKHKGRILKIHSGNIYDLYDSVNKIEKHYLFTDLRLMCFEGVREEDLDDVKYQGLFREGEQARDVIGFEGLYQITNQKRVFSLPRWHEVKTRWSSTCLKRVEPCVLFVDRDGFVHLFDKDHKQHNVSLDRIYREAWGEEEGEQEK